jgi:transposase-like protein
MIVGLLHGSTIERRRRVAGADRMTIEEVVKQGLLDEHADVIREAVKAVCAEMMELEVSELIAAPLGERRPDDRAAHRNGCRPRRWDIRAGGIELQIPRSARAATSLRSWKRAGAPSRRW